MCTSLYLNILIYQQFWTKSIWSTMPRPTRNSQATADDSLVGGKMAVSSINARDVRSSSLLSSSEARHALPAISVAGLSRFGSGRQPKAGLSSAAIVGGTFLGRFEQQSTLHVRWIGGVYP